MVLRNPYARVVSLSILASCLSSTLWSFFPGPLGLLCFVAITSIVLIYWLVVLSLVVITAFAKRWMDFGFQAVSLAASVPLAFVAIGAGDYLHLFIAYPYYRSVINKTAERPVRFYWGDDALMIWDGLQLRTLVYDDSGRFGELGMEHRENGLSSETAHPLGNFFIEHSQY